MRAGFCATSARLSLVAANVLVVTFMIERPDISVVVTAHGEGPLIHRTLRSLLAAQTYAEGHGLTVEVVVVRDAATEETQRYFSQFQILPFRQYDVSFHDPGLSRSYGVEQARGRTI